MNFKNEIWNEMTKLEAIIQPNRFDAVKEALID